MNTSQTPALVASQRIAAWLFVICGMLGVATLSRTLAPEELINSLGIPFIFLEWALLIAIAVVWFLDLSWRPSAVVWLQTVTYISGAVMLLTFGASALLHLGREKNWNEIIASVAIAIAIIPIFLARGFYQRQEWARITALRLCQFGVITTIVFGFFSGIKASEMWTTLQCAITWYWLTRPEITSLFRRGAPAA